MMARMRQPAADRRKQAGTGARQSIVAGRIRIGRNMVTRLSGAVLRAALVVLLIATPSVLLPAAGSDITEIVALVAIFAAVFTIVEYTAISPSLVEFRDAPPFNRIRFVSLAASVFSLSVILRGHSSPSTITQIFDIFGYGIGQLLDVPLSPVRLVLLALPDDATPELVGQVRTAAALSYLFSLTSLAMFAGLLRFRGWPMRNGNFNVWINLPTFDPTTGADVIWRLRRDAQINLGLGFLLPFLIPAFFKMGVTVLGPLSLSNPHTLIWAMTAWAFLPASLLMRGVALHRVAEMIGAQRQRAHARAIAAGLATA